MGIAVFSALLLVISVISKMVGCGLGVSVMPELLLKNCPEDVCCLPLNPPASRTIGLCLPDADRAGPATRRFAERACEWVRAHF